MRALVRYIATGIWAFLAISVGTVFRQNIEEFASDHGWNDALSQWWLGMSIASYSVLVLLGFVALTGAVATLWIDAAVRSMIARRRRGVTRHISFRYYPDSKCYDNDSTIGIAGFHILTDERERETRPVDPSLSRHKSVLTIVYEHPVDRPDFSVAATHPILFQITFNGDKFAYIDIDWRGATEPVEVDVFVFSIRNREGLHKWEDHWHEVADNTKVENRVPQSLLEIETRNPH